MTIDRLHSNAADLAADYKARGIERQASYSQFVKDRALKPEMDAKEFFQLFDAVTPRLLETHDVELAEDGQWFVLHYKSGHTRRVVIKERAEWGVRWVDDTGLTGSDPMAILSEVVPERGVIT